jgi:hypothetical protein
MKYRVLNTIADSEAVCAWGVVEIRQVEPEPEGRNCDSEEGENSFAWSVHDALGAA